MQESPKTSFSTVNPHSGAFLKEYSYMNPDQCASVIQQMQKTSIQWRQLSHAERAQNLLKFADRLRLHKKNIATSMSQEMGKPIKQSLAEIDKCVQLVEYGCQHVEKILAPKKEDKFTLYYQPLGIIYGIMPWNFPVWQSLRFAVPSLLAGNVVVLKPAESVTATGLWVQKAFDEVDDLKNIFSTLIISHETSNSIIAHKDIHGISLTGSSRAGAQVAAIAGKYIKKCVLELGGNDAYIVCKDADLDLAAEKAYQGRILNTGQSCISAKRLFVHTSIANAFSEKLVQKIKQIRLGDPLNSEVDMGPLARIDLKRQLEEQVSEAVKDGASVLFQQNLEALKGQAAYFPVTVLHNIDSKNCVHSQELFGPVFLIIPFEDEDEAICMANQSPYGLGGAVFSQDTERAKRIALRVETGSLAINDFLRSTFDRPFGGVKDSGYGRELGREGFFEFINTKVIVHN
ncbi:MAG: aldehyde dehydrogenase family protein [Bdellovibrionaceae bacterium]|nr:aldehyde dehydrogenase family protein [Pseudobdellovibrionaceae bacterium]